MKPQRNLTRFGILLAAVFWIVDSFIDAQLSGENISFMQSLTEPDAVELWMRSFVILLFLIFSAYAQRLLRTIDSMRAELQHYHDQLEYTVAELKMEINERKLAIEELEQLAETDSLTSLINRRKFQEILDYEVERNQRYRSGLSLIMCDIDHFKKINDQFGHVAGDEALIVFAEKISENIREVDIFSRWGGEEFMILMPNANLGNASAVAEKLRIVIEQTNVKDIDSFTASFGVTHYNEGDDAESFLKRADDALYRAKEKGRNTVESTV